MTIEYKVPEGTSPEVVSGLLELVNEYIIVSKLEKGEVDDHYIKLKQVYEDYVCGLR